MLKMDRSGCWRWDQPGVSSLGNKCLINGIKDRGKLKHLDDVYCPEQVFGGASEGERLAVCVYLPPVLAEQGRFELHPALAADDTLEVRWESPRPERRNKRK